MNKPILTRIVEARNRLQTCGHTPRLVLLGVMEWEALTKEIKADKHTSTAKQILGPSVAHKMQDSISDHPSANMTLIFGLRVQTILGDGVFVTSDFASA